MDDDVTAPVLDPTLLQGLRELYEQDNAGMADLIALFLRDAWARIESLQAALPQHDFGALAKGAHSLRGSCANFAATRMASLCGQLEGAGPDDPDRLTALVEQLVEEYHAAADALRTEFGPGHEGP